MRFGNRPFVTTALRLVAVVLGGAWLCSLPASGQNYPAPNNEAALYAAAKTEGSLVWSVGGPLEAMNEIAAEFEKQYPGVKVQTLRAVGVLQYQRFIDESNAKKYFGCAPKYGLSEHGFAGKRRLYR